KQKQTRIVAMLYAWLSPWGPYLPGPDPGQLHQRKGLKGRTCQSTSSVRRCADSIRSTPRSTTSCELTPHPLKRRLFHPFPQRGIPMRRVYFSASLTAIAVVVALLLLRSTAADQAKALPEASPGLKTTQLPIGQVVLFSSGVGYFQRE